MVASTREYLGQICMEADVGPRGPLFRKWWDTRFSKDYPRSKLDPYADELQLLITLLDEVHAGRMVEV